LLAAGTLQSGITLYPRRKKFAAQRATLLPDGRIDLSGAVYASPSEAAKVIREDKSTNGWHFFLVDPVAKRSLGDVRRDYLESFALDVDDEDDDEESDDDA
jgi:hypothetical protein